MSLREGYPPAGVALLSFVLPRRRRPHGPAAAGGRLGDCSARALSFAWTASVTLYVAFHDDVMGAILAHQVEMKAAYEDRLAEARAQLDEAASRQLLERNSFKGKVNEIMSRQARLEQRGAIVAALAETEARNPSSPARRQAAAPPSRRAERDPGSRSRRPPPAQAWTTRRAPTPPFPTPSSLGPSSLIRLTNSGETERPALGRAFHDRECDWSRGQSRPLGAPCARRSLARPDRERQTKALAAIDRAAERSASRDAAIVAETGLDPAKLSRPTGKAASAAPISQPRLIRTRSRSTRR